MQICPGQLKVYPLAGEEEELADLALDLFENAVIVVDNEGHKARHRLLASVEVDVDVDKKQGCIEILFNEAALRVAEQPGHEYHDVIRLLLQRAELQA
ncbi:MULTISPECIES: hypothetical protein [Pseudomonas]|uniref:hypothetical protein n=1 Tax=Pseudomonas TaxID=286 RepID=UPI000F0217A1|nr:MULTISPECIES: hypothetical protein [Pseudomonas]MBD8615074.1 hypothetical protein [Pseudomonas putida]MBD8681250.1 hypothetical protein [Pseudomonas sp. CFBP 13719]